MHRIRGLVKNMKKNFARAMALCLVLALLPALALADRTRFPSEWGDPKAGITIKEINGICKYPTIGDYLDSCEYTWPRYAEVYDKLPKMFFGAGMKDLCYPKVLEFKEYTEKLGAQNVTFDFVPGYAHEWDFWDLEIVKVMDFFGL